MILKDTDNKQPNQFLTIPFRLRLSKLILIFDSFSALKLYKAFSV